MSSSEAVLNPYQPVPLLHLLPGTPAYHPHQSLEIDVRRSLLLRRIEIRGRLEADIVWNARHSSEFVTLNGRRVASKISWLYVPQFRFDIETGDSVLPAQIDVNIDWLFHVAGFQLQIDECVVYREGELANDARRLPWVR